MNVRSNYALNLKSASMTFNDEPLANLDQYRVGASCWSVPSDLLPAGNVTVRFQVTEDIGSVPSGTPALPGVNVVKY